MRLAMLTAALLLVLAPAASAACKGDSYVAGSVDLCSGTLVYHDYVADDYGADDGSSPSKSWGSLAAQSGDKRYPDDASEETADLVGVALSVRGDKLHVRFDLAALSKPDQTLGAIAIDTDGNDATGGGAWPGVAGVSSKGWEVVKTFDRGDTAANTIEGDLPLPGGRRWRVQALTAQKGGPVMNVAFRGLKESGAWWEDGQAAALKAGDVSAYGQTVDVADLTSHVTRPAPDPGPGLYERVYRSDYAIGGREGYTYSPVKGRAGDAPLFAQEYQMLGRWQPYDIYVPKAPGPHGIQLSMHGSGASFSSIMNGATFQQRLGDEPNRIIVSPEARGQNGFYSDYSERDVLDAIADVEAHYPVDRDSVVAGGYSMGGYGTLRFSTLFPDRFAGYTNWVGFTGDDGNGAPAGFPVHYTAGAIGNPVDLVGNLRYVPGASLYGGADELVHVWSSQLGLQQALDKAGVPYVFYMHPVAEHFTFAVLGDWRKEAAYVKGLRLRHDPPRVTFRTASFLDAPQLGIRHDRAYWVSDIRPSGDGYADVDLTTHGCGGTLPVVTAQQPGGGGDPVPWVSSSSAVTGQTALARERRITGTLHGVRSLAVDARAACLDGAGPVAYDITSDGPATLRLARGRTLRLGAGHDRGVLRLR
jgi:dienelactone hydrolase